jgi:hypothetical protein
MQSLLALAIVIYTATQLSSVNVDLGGVLGSEDTLSEDFCALGTGGGPSIDGFSAASISNSNCLFLEILGGITIAVGIVIGIIQCFSKFTYDFLNIFHSVLLKKQSPGVQVLLTQLLSTFF